MQKSGGSLYSNLCEITNFESNSYVKKSCKILITKRKKEFFQNLNQSVSKSFTDEKKHTINFGKGHFQQNYCARKRLRLRLPTTAKSLNISKQDVQEHLLLQTSTHLLLTELEILKMKEKKNVKTFMCIQLEGKTFFGRFLDRIPKLPHTNQLNLIARKFRPARHTRNGIFMRIN